MEKLKAFNELVGQLIDPKNGCRWLKEQNFSSIAPYSIEEAYELVEAIEGEDPKCIRDELADQLYHLLIYTQLADGAGWFSLDDIVDTAMKKQVERRDLENLSHCETPEEAHAYWREQKRVRQLEANPEQGALDDVSRSLPAMIRSQKLQDRAGHVGFDWNNVNEVIGKLHEEIDELEAELGNLDQERMLDEYGDMLFTLVNVGRHLKINPEQALRHANNKFLRRFRGVERHLRQRKQAMDDLSFEELLEIWEEVKREE